MQQSIKFTKIWYMMWFFGSCYIYTHTDIHYILYICVYVRIDVHVYIYIYIYIYLYNIYIYLDIYLDIIIHMTKRECDFRDSLVLRKALTIYFLTNFYMFSNWINLLLNIWNHWKVSLLSDFFSASSSLHDTKLLLKWA